MLVVLDDSVSGTPFRLFSIRIGAARPSILTSTKPMTAIGLSSVACDISRRFMIAGTFSRLWMQTSIRNSESRLQCWMVLLFKVLYCLEGL
jgi:hypothetical protein